MKKLISALCAGAIALSLMSVSAFAQTELPTADISVLTDSNLLYGLEFTATETEEEVAESPYKDWIADFEVSFNKDLNMDDIILAGQYEGYDWTALQLEDDYVAGTAIKVMELLDKGVYTYADIVKDVNSFKCGIAAGSTDADLSGLEATVALCLYKGEDKEVVSERNVKILPTAEISEIDVENAMYALQFDATETDVEDEVYANYVVDFELSFNMNLDKDDVVLGGEYEGYDWTALQLEDDYVAGTAIKVMELLDKGVYTYTDIVNDVKSFKCAVFQQNIEIDLSDLVATVDLCMYNGDKKYVVGTKTLAVAAEDVELPSCNVSLVDDVNLLAGLQFDAVDTEEDVADKAYKNWVADFEVSFNKDLNKDDVILGGEYEGYDWTALQLEDDYVVGTAIKVMELLDKGVYTYTDIVKDVKSFKCGIAAGSTGADLTDVVASVVLCLYDEDGNRYEVSDVYSFNLGNRAFWITDTDAGYYLVNGDKSGLIRFLFKTDSTTHTAVGVNLGRVGNETKIEEVETETNTQAFYADINNITLNMAGNTYWAKGYAVVGEDVIWSDTVFATPNFDRQFTAAE